MSRERSDATVVLVAGGARVDAGKTTFSTGLVASLADRAGDAIGVKPRAGNDYWYDHDDYRIASDAGRLYGKDARRLAAASTRSLPVPDERRRPEAVTPESINPVHRLWRPTPGRTGMLGDTDRTFLCDRVTTEDGSRFVVNGAAEAAGLLPDGLTDRLPLAAATRVDDVAAFNDVMAADYLPAFDRIAARVAAATVPVVVESYADIAGALPREGPVAPDAVAVVDPGRARVYAGDRYAKARTVASGSPREGTMEEHTGTVTEMIEPLATVDLPALSSDERGDPARVAERYGHAYETLLEAV
ncbi:MULTISPECIES: ATPase [Halorubrum]|uniref:ATPase n=1 Tax=Halorubrum persicum TaxID=1383844 RepID=A0A2G1WLN0_9EURY|nr:ATPase [Halorubrum persicum]PHQ39911.1 ATPase [Halorubrum persicum]